MSEHNEQVRSLQSQVESLEYRLKGLDEEKVQAQISEFESACAGKDAEIAELQSKLEAAKETHTALDKSVEELDTAKADSESKIAELVEKLDTIEAESLKTSRISALVDKGVDKADAETLVETFTGISVEQFEALVETQSKLVEANKPSSDAKADESAKAPNHYFDDKDKKKKKKKKDEEEDEAKAEEAAEAAEEAVDADTLEEAEAEESPALAAHSENESDSVLASLNTYFSEILGGNNNKEES